MDSPHPTALPTEPIPMRLPRLRLRLRTLLIAVAVAGTALGGWTMRERRRACLSEAQRLRYSGYLHALSGNHREADRCVARARAYRHVARYPWLPMPRESE